MSEYLEIDHTKKASPHTLKLYNSLKTKILDLGNVDIVVWQKYVAFKRRKNFCGIKVRKDKLRVKIYVPKGKLIDPENIAHDFPYETWGYDDYEAFVENESDIDKVMNLVKQAYSQAR